MAVLFANNATGRLASSVSLEQTTISLQSGQGARFPSPSGGDWFPITAVKANGSLEIMRCTARAGDVLTVIRAQESTVEREWAPGDVVSLRITVGALAQFKADVTDQVQGFSIPAGLIAKWHGSILNIPAGWVLCNGANGTPDLSDRFVVGAGSTYSVGDTGGSASVTLTTAQMPAHNHSVTVNNGGSHNHSASTGSAGSHSHSGSARSAGAHTHSVRTLRPSGGTNFSGNRPHSSDSSSGGDTNSGAATSAGAHTHTLTVNSNGSHSHSVSVASGGTHNHSASSANTGGGESHENRPPYYALAYIMKL